MNYIPGIIRIAHKEGADIAYFTDITDLYTNLSGKKDNIDTLTEFIQVGDIIQYKDKNLKVVEVYLRLQQIDFGIEHIMKNKENLNSRMNIQVEIFIEYA